MRYHAYFKAWLIEKKRRGENVSALLVEHGISAAEFSEWEARYEQAGHDGLQCKFLKKARLNSKKSI